MLKNTLLRMKQVEAACGLRKSAIYKRLKENDFPLPVLLGSRHVAWRSCDIERWIEERPYSNKL